MHANKIVTLTQKLFRSLILHVLYAEYSQKYCPNFEYINDKFSWSREALSIEAVLHEAKAKTHEAEAETNTHEAEARYFGLVAEARLRG